MYLLQHIDIANFLDIYKAINTINPLYFIKGTTRGYF